MIHDESSSKDGLTLSPKMSFVMGLVGGVLVLCTIGFFILLAVVLKGGLPNKVIDTTTGVTDTGSGQPSAPSPSVPPEDEVGDVDPVTSDDHVRGPANAPVTMIEWSDYECPFCQRFHDTMNQIMSDSDLKGKVKWVFRHYPLSFHPEANPAALAAECAGEQGKFWEFTDKVYEYQSEIGSALYSRLVTELKLNKSKFDDCLSSKKYQSVVDAHRNSGNKAGVTGTPGTVIIGADGSLQLVPGALPLEAVKPMIQSVLP